MKTCRRFRPLLPLILISACSAWRPQTNPVELPASPEARYSQTDLTELLRYGDEVLGMSEEWRQSECARLLGLLTPEAPLGIRLHLLQVQALDEKCGNPQQTLDGLAVAKEGLNDEATSRWLGFQERLLARILSQEERIANLEKQLKQTRRIADSNRKLVMTREIEKRELENERRALLQKLEDLKSIEQNIGGKKSGGSHE